MKNVQKGYQTCSAGISVSANLKIIDDYSIFINKVTPIHS